MKTRSSRVTAVILLLLICAVVAIYRHGWFDVSFVVRPDVETDANSDTDSGAADTDDDTTLDSALIIDTPEQTDTNSTSTESAPVTDSSDGGSDVPVEPEFAFPTVAEVDADYTRSYEEWVSDGDEWVLALTEFETPSYFSSEKRNVYTVTYVAQEDRSPYQPVYTKIKEDKPAILLYMGYIIVETDTEDRSNIYTSKRKLIGSFDDKNITLAWCRDTEDRPLFIYKDAYYYLDEKKGRFVESDYDPETESRGACFDYSPEYGVETTDRRFLSTSEIVYTYEPIEGMFDEEGYQLAYKIPHVQYTYALSTKANKVLSEYIYYGRYPFSESLAAVIDEEGHLYYIKTTGKVAIKASKVRNDVELGNKVYDFYMEPITNGEESIGFYYFDRGLVRVRVMTVDYARYNREERRIYVVSDKDILIYEDGDKFQTPEGYDIKAYSSGMILLERDGKYGYMDYTGAWIVEPTLTYAEPFYEGVAVIGNGDERALIDRNGAYVIPFGEYSYISNASMGIIAVYGEDDGWQVIYKMKKD